LASNFEAKFEPLMSASATILGRTRFSSADARLIVACFDAITRYPFIGDDHAQASARSGGAMAARVILVQLSAESLKRQKS
jgi:hypothetical protein